jgi:hypothetical protein
VISGFCHGANDMRSFAVLCSEEWKFHNDVGQPIGPIYKAQAVKQNSSWTACPLKMGPIGCPATSGRNYHSTLRKSQNSTDLSIACADMVLLPRNTG